MRSLILFLVVAQSQHGPLRITPAVSTEPNRSVTALYSISCQRIVWEDTPYTAYTDSGIAYQTSSLAEHAYPCAVDDNAPSYVAKDGIVHFGYRK
jgi:hypothetical protein